MKKPRLSRGEHSLNWGLCLAPIQMLHLAFRKIQPCIGIRLKASASQRMVGTSNHSGEENSESEESDGDSSSSLQRFSDSPHYSDLVHSIVSDDESQSGLWR